MPLKPDDFDYIRRLVRADSSVALEPGKEYLAESRLAPVASRAGADGVAGLVALLRQGPPAPGSEAGDLRRQVVEAMMTHETSFFRDGHPFEALRDPVIPELIARRADRKRLTLWSAACASGQEPYSLALLLREHFPQLAGWDLTVLATDVSQEMIERARAGRYSRREVDRGVPPHLLRKYFRRVGDGDGDDWQVAEGVRRVVRFRRLNLCDDWPALPPIDVVLLRNVMMYFETATKAALLGRVARALAPGGYLVLGGAETTLRLSDSFERRDFERCGFYRVRA